MKTGILIIFIFILGIAVGSQLEQVKKHLGISTEQHMDSADEAKKPLYWVAPMDKNYRRDRPGLSPMGMELVPVYAEEDAGGEGDVKISPAVENNLGVKTADVVRTDLYQTIETVGTVQFNESKITHLHSRVEGWIEVLNISTVGDRVQKGQTLYELYSPALVNAQEEYLAALRSGNNNLINASKSRLLALGLDSSHLARLEQRRKVDQRVQVISEVDGVVKSLMVRQGMFIKPATEIASIAPLSSVWVIGDVLERQSHLLALNQTVEITLTGLPGKQWQGNISYIYPEVNPMTRTLQVRVTLNNPDGVLKPNMLASLKIRSNRLENVLAIPRNALIKSGQHQRVVKAFGDGKYQSVMVESGAQALHAKTDLPMVQILSGLSEGDRVVSSAQFLIDSESNIDAELERMQAADSANGDSKADQNTVLASGVINSVMADHAMLNITHEPIPEWDWPDMRMNFDVAPDVNMNQLKTGQEISFTIRKKEGGGIIITEIRILNDSSAAASEHDHANMQEMDINSSEEMSHVH